MVYEENLKLKVFLLKHKIKHKDVANLLNISKSMFSLKINGIKDFKFGEIKKMQQEYNFSLDDIFLS